MQSGKPCLNMLDNSHAWFPGITVVGIMLSLQHLLAHPTLENPVNVPAAEIFASSRRLYEQLARDCVVASRRLTDDSVKEEPVAELQAEIRHTLIEKAPKQNAKAAEPPKVSRLSFDDYHLNWKTMATSAPIDAEFQQRTGVIVLEGQSARAKLNEKQFREMVERQKTLWYGNFSKPQKTPKRQDTSENRLQAWKSPGTAKEMDRPIETPDAETVLSEKSSNTDSTLSRADIPANSKTGSISMSGGSQGMSGSDNPYASGDEDWEQEALELEEWTSSLNVEE
ncbi:Ubiquitin-conjugating enzyme E2 U [Dinochytrium kinnereticum]|nr:Ubiquitin-conjugating enzyme E2 U [Dinochytrium kinnereticum]